MIFVKNFIRFPLKTQVFAMAEDMDLRRQKTQLRLKKQLFAVYGSEICVKKQKTIIIFDIKLKKHVDTMGKL